MKNLLLLWAVCGSVFVSAKVLEIRKMEEAVPYLKPQTWVVFDLDNTVMETAQTLGGDQWFDYLVKKLNSLDAAIAAWSKIQDKTRMVPVEPTTPKFIQGLQKKYYVFALTARPEDLAKRTEQQLSEMGLKFAKVVLIGPGKSKGDAMMEELKNTQSRPKRILFIDDKEKHVQSVDAALKGTGIENFEFRYGAADPKVKTFRPEIAELQMKEFEKNGTLISDATADKRLKTKLN